MKLCLFAFLLSLSSALSASCTSWLSSTENESGPNLIRLAKLVLVKNQANPKLKAWATIIFDDAIMVRNIRVIEDKGKLFLSMPRETLPVGDLQINVVTLLKNAGREVLEQLIFTKYEEMKQGGRESFQLEKTVFHPHRISISDIKLLPRDREDSKPNVEGYVSLVFNGYMRFERIRIINANSKRFLQFPNRQILDYGWLETAHPISSEIRSVFEKMIFEAEKLLVGDKK